MATSGGTLVDYFLKVEGLTGPSFDEKHPGAFELKDWSFGVENPTTIGSATGGARAGKVRFNEFTIKKTTDAASPLFFKNCCTGAHYKTVTLYCRKAGAEQNDFMKVRFSDVLVSSYANGLAGGEPPDDDIALNYAKLQMTSDPTTFAVNPVTGGTLVFDPKTNTFEVTGAESGVLEVGTRGGVSTRGVQEYDVTNLLPLLKSGGGTLTLLLDEVRVPPPDADLPPPDPDLNFDVILYAPADLQLTVEDLSRRGKRIGSIHVEPRKDPASLELNCTDEVREAALGTFGLRVELRGTNADWSGPGDEGPEERKARNASALFTMAIRFDTT